MPESATTTEPTMLSISLMSSSRELGIVPMKFEHAFYCTRTSGMATTKTSPSLPEERIHLSGTKVRELAA
jgi:ATP sulfurylase